MSMARILLFDRLIAAVALLIWGRSRYDLVAFRRMVAPCAFTTTIGAIALVGLPLILCFAPLNHCRSLTT
ncbi:MAG TPA: hypothetical protein VK001_08985 [Geminicoccaceae bacterium]|nr:hypothetical protein [Geminicoccaceae bacterium]